MQKFVSKNVWKKLLVTILQYVSKKSGLFIRYPRTPLYMY